MYFSKVSVPTRISTDPGHGTRIARVFYPYFQWLRGRLEPSHCVWFLLLPDSPEWSPMERRAPAQSSSRDQCTRGPSSRNNTNTFAVQVLLMHLFQTLYTRYAGIAHHRALQTSGRGWADSKAVHRMECNGGVHALLEVSLSVGAAA